MWVYDLRTNMPNFGKRTPFTRAYFAEFEQCYGADANGGSERVDQGEGGRFRCFDSGVCGAAGREFGYFVAAG